MYKYYKGWVFDYEHPGFFVYYQMGGPLSVYFTPDHNQKGEVDLQVSDDKGNILASESIPYRMKEETLPYGIDPFALFKLVRPTLEAHGTW
jgi:hypothetical protein